MDMETDSSDYLVAFGIRNPFVIFITFILDIRDVWYTSWTPRWIVARSPGWTGRVLDDYCQKDPACDDLQSSSMDMLMIGSRQSTEAMLRGDQLYMLDVTAWLDYRILITPTT
jgi:hypothetical protein